MGGRGILYQRAVELLAETGMTEKRGSVLRSTEKHSEGEMAESRAGHLHAQVRNYPTFWVRK